MMTSTGDTWVSYVTARTRLGVGAKCFYALVEDGKLTRLQVPGARAKYRLSEIEALLAASMTKASKPAGAKG